MYNTTYESIVSNEHEINFSSKHTKFWKNKKKLSEKREKIDFCISVPDFYSVFIPKLNSNFCIFEKGVKIRIKWFEQKSLISW